LAADDRLEPSEMLSDIAMLDEMATPARVVFWRCCEESISRHRNPLFDPELGISISSLAVDTLHCVYLGVLNTWCYIVLWFILSSGLYGNVGGADETLQVSVLAFRHRLLGWYKDRHQECPQEVLTRVSDFTAKMLGTRSAPKCKTKGAETWGLCLFLLDELRLHLHRLGERGARLLLAGEALHRVIKIWDEHGCNISEAGREDP
jgi:hypothetical protein